MDRQFHKYVNRRNFAWAQRWKRNVHCRWKAEAHFEVEARATNSTKGFKGVPTSDFKPGEFAVFISPRRSFGKSDLARYMGLTGR